MKIDRRTDIHEVIALIMKQKYKLIFFLAKFVLLVSETSLLNCVTVILEFNRFNSTPNFNLKKNLIYLFNYFNFLNH